MYNRLLPHAAFLAHNDVLMLGFGVWLACFAQGQVGASTSGVFARFEKSATKVLEHVLFCHTQYSRRVCTVSMATSDANVHRLRSHAIRFVCCLAMRRAVIIVRRTHFTSECEASTGKYCCFPRGDWESIFMRRLCLTSNTLIRTALASAKPANIPRMQVAC